MPCICQYFVTSKDKGSKSGYLNDSFVVENIGDTATDRGKTVGSAEVSASSLAASRAEVWVLKKNISEMQISIENLEHLVRTMLTKQNELIGEMHELKRQNTELQEEFQMQQRYQAYERNTMIRELYDIKLLLNNRSKILEDTVAKNTQLTDALKDANKKIYMMGMKFLKLKEKRSDFSVHSSVSSTTHRSSASVSTLDSDSASMCSSRSSRRYSRGSSD